MVIMVILCGYHGNNCATLWYTMVAHWYTIAYYGNHSVTTENVM